MWPLIAMASPYSVPCKHVDTDLFRRTKFLCDEVRYFTSMVNDTDHEITVRTSEGRQTDTDSSDKDIPDHPVCPPVSDTELLVATMYYKKLFGGYKAATRIGLYNAIGKDFMTLAWDYVDLCSRLDLRQSSQFLCKSNTAKGSPQLGQVPKRQLKSSSGISHITLSNERYADHVSVTEVKESQEAAIVSQHNEQMVGLWRSGQQVMLGIEASGKCMRPKVAL